MAASALPAALLRANWDKQKGVLTKPTGIGDALAALAKLNAGIDAALFDTTKLKTAAEAQERAGLLDGDAARKVKAAGDAARSLATLGKKWEAEFKKAAAKEAAVACAAVAKAAAAWGDELAGQLDAARKELATLRSRLDAADKKADAADATPAGDLKLVRDRVTAALKTVKASGPDDKPMQFVVAAGPQQCLLFMGPSVGASHKTLLAKLMPGESGIKYFSGQCVWEDKACVFIGENIPGGAFAKRLQQALLDLTQQRVPVQTRRPDGSTDEPEPDETASFTARFTRLMPAVKNAIAAAGPSAQAIRLKAGEAGTLAAGKQFAKAQALLDELEGLLSRAAAAPAAQGGDLAAALAQWQATRAAVIAQLGKLGAAIQATRHAASTEAIIQLRAIQANLSAKPDTLRSIAELERYLTTDDIIAEAEAPNGFGVEVDIEEPLMAALAQVKRCVAA